MCWGLGVLFWALNNEHLFLRVLKAKKFKIKLPAASVSGKHPFLVCRWLLTCCNLTRHRFPKVTKPIMQTLPDCLPKACVCAQLLKQCPTLQPHGLQPARIFCPWNFSGKNTGVGCYFLLQGIYPTQVWSLGLLHWQASGQDQGKPKMDGKIPHDQQYWETLAPLSLKGQVEGVVPKNYGNKK